MPHTRLRPTFPLTEERLAELNAIVPEALADGKINWDVLREILGEHLDHEGAQAEHFGLFWPGKRAAGTGTPMSAIETPAASAIIARLLTPFENS